MAQQPIACLFPNCERPQEIRGLCTSHYNAALKLVTAKRTTWKKLESLGKSFPTKKRENVKDWFLNNK